MSKSLTFTEARPMASRRPSGERSQSPAEPALRGEAQRRWPGAFPRGWGIRPVAHFRGDFFDLIAHGGGDLRVVALRHRDGDMADAQPGGDLAHADAGRGVLGGHRVRRADDFYPTSSIPQVAELPVKAADFLGEWRIRCDPAAAGALSEHLESCRKEPKRQNPLLFPQKFFTDGCGCGRPPASRRAST